MVFFNYALRKLNAKIVYYGPGLCGKTTNLQWIHDHFEGGQRGKMISLSTEGDRTIFFDLLPLEIGTIRGMEVTLQLYTVPGQVHYNSTRQLVLRGADGVVFVADSQRTMHQSNIDSLRNLQENLMLQGVDLKGFPHVLQFNKRDLRDLITVEELDRELNLHSVPFFEAIATEGVGVQETLEGIVKLVMRSLRERYEPVVAAGDRPAAPARVTTTVPPPGQPVQPPPVAPVRPPAPTPPTPHPRPAQTPAGATPGTAAPTPASFQVGSEQDHVETGVYSAKRQQGRTPPPATVQPPTERPPVTPPRQRPAAPRPAATPPPEQVPPTLPDEPTKVTEIPGVDRQPPSWLDFEGPASQTPPSRPAPPPPQQPGVAMPFADQQTDTSIPIAGTEAIDIPTQADAGFAFGGSSDFEEPPVVEELLEAEEPPEVEQQQLVAEPAAVELPHGEPESPPDVPAAMYESRSDPFRGITVDPPTATEPGVSPLPPLEPDDLASAGFEDDIEAQAPPVPPLHRDVPSPDETDTVVPRSFPGSSVDDLVASVLGNTIPSSVVDIPAVKERPPIPSRLRAPTRPRSEPVTLGKGDPFAVPEPTAPPGGYVLAPSRPSDEIVRVEDNQLHLRLQGTGAIAESGQVRALDIEVPVPGSWVGNRRVTLQLRLTLSPASEDEDGGQGDPS